MWSTSQADVDLTMAGVPYYFVEDNWCYEICNLWIYEEANGLPGLQRDDEIVDDTCHGLILPDTIII